MKYAADRPYANPEEAARRLMEHAQAFEPVQDGRIYIEKINGPFLSIDKATAAEYSAGLKTRARTRPQTESPRRDIATGFRRPGRGVAVLPFLTIS